MNKQFFWLCILIPGSICISSCGGPAPAANPAAAAVPVNVYEVKREQATYFDLYPGTLVPLNEVELRSQVNGYVTGILFKEGQTVSKGQKLYEIERSKYAAAYAQAEASVKIAQANLSKAQKDADRYNKLNQQEAIAKQTLDYALTNLESTKSQVAAAQAQLSSALTDLQHAVIAAPFDGTIGISQVKLGASVTGGQTLLNTISSDNPITVDFVVTEKDLNRFIGLQQQPVDKKDTTFTILLPDNSLYPLPGHIALIDRAVDPQTGTIKVRLNFPNPDRQLRAGMSCNVRVLNSGASQQLLVPFKAITEQMGEYFVYVVERDTARQRKVMLGSRVMDKVIVHSGLAVGDPIVLEGIQKLRDNTAVQVGAPQTAPQSGAQPANAASSSR
jgi:membrane fusion protein (multidrug efflux system)